jgi:hypothetical protein
MKKIVADGGYRRERIENSWLGYKRAPPILLSQKRKNRRAGMKASGSDYSGFTDAPPSANR